MQASSLLFLRDRSMGQLDLSGISDQAIMEAFIDGLNDTSKQQFKTSDGQYKDVCKWNGILCNGRRQVKEIMWDSTKQHYFILVGKLSFVNFSAHIKSISIICCDPGDEKMQVQFVESDTSSLPIGMKWFHVENAWIKSLNLRRLPSGLRALQAIDCGIHGSCCLKALPRRLQGLFLSYNYLKGTICLDRLPSTLLQMDLSINDLSGTINLRSLPSALSALSDNYLSVNYSHRQIIITFFF